MGEAHAPLKRDIMPPELQPLLAAAGIDGSIAVQARQTPKETAFLLDLAERYPFIRGVVGWVDLRAPDVAAQLERLAAHPKLVGIRHIVHDEADDHFMLGSDFLRGLAALEAFDLSYDLLLFPRHLPVAIQVLRRFPRQRFILDHIAKPDIKARAIEPWARDIRALARHDNVCCKLSGMVTEADWGAWKAADFQPYLELVLQCFGTQRLMFGSDWPVCTLAASYRQVHGIVQSFIAGLSTSEQAEIMGGNAQRLYRLPAATGAS